MRRNHYASYIIGAALVMFWTKDAYAYLDPGTGSMILQAVIAGVAAGLIVIRLWWSKVKVFCARMMGRAQEADARSEEGETRIDSDRRH